MNFLSSLLTIAIAAAMPPPPAGHGMPPGLAGMPPGLAMLIAGGLFGPPGAMPMVIHIPGVPANNGDQMDLNQAQAQLNRPMDPIITQYESRLTLNADAVFLPTETFHQIFSYLDGLTLLNVAACCKLFAHYIHDARFGYQATIADPSSMSDIALKSELWLQQWMVKPINQALPGWTLENYGKLEFPENDPIEGNRWVQKLLERSSKDLKVLYRALMNLNCPRPEAYLPEFMAHDLMMGIACWDHDGLDMFGSAFWTPSDLSCDLAHQLDVGLAVALRSQAVFRNLLVPFVIAKYLIPHWKQIRFMTQDEVAFIHELAKSSHFLLHYTQMLHGAIFFLTGTLNPEGSQEMKAFHQLFLSIGLAVDSVGDDDEEFKAELLNDTPHRKILMSAELWGLDTMKIAEGMRDCSAFARSYLLQAGMIKRIQGEPTAYDVLQSIIMDFTVPIPCIVLNGFATSKPEEAMVEEVDDDEPRTSSDEDNDEKEINGLKRGLPRPPSDRLSKRQRNR